LKIKKFYKPAREAAHTTPRPVKPRFSWAHLRCYWRTDGAFSAIVATLRCY